MNGRVYDPELGRFFQADPFVQDPTSAESLNRYAYLMNNPLNGTDPSGYFGIKDVIAIAIPIIAFAACGPASGIGGLTALAKGGISIGTAILNAAAVGFASGFAAGSSQPERSREL